MRLSAYICSLILIFIALCGGAYAFFGVDALLFLSFYSVTIKRIVLSLGAVSALYMLYAIIFLRPFKRLK